MPKVRQSIESIVVKENGDVISQTIKKKVSWESEPPYIKLYLQDVLYFQDMPKSHENILFELLKRATYAGEKDGMQVGLSSGIKKIIAKNLGLKSVHSIDNSLYELVKGKVIFRVDTGVYNLNPVFFGKGDWQDVARLRLEINYDEIKGKTFKAVCSYKEDEKNIVAFPSANVL